MRDGIPQTPIEMESMVFLAIISRVYGDVTRVATTKRLTERDIRTIEESALVMPGDMKALAKEFVTFEAEPAIRAALENAKEFFRATKAGRLKQR